MYRQGDQTRASCKHAEQGPHLLTSWWAHKAGLPTAALSIQRVVASGQGVVTEEYCLGKMALLWRVNTGQLCGCEVGLLWRGDIAMSCGGETGLLWGGDAVGPCSDKMA